jgi:hypothetical protein
MNPVRDYNIKNMTIISNNGNVAFPISNGMKKHLSIRAIAPLLFTLVVICLLLAALAATSPVAQSAAIENPLKVGASASDKTVLRRYSYRRALRSCFWLSSALNLLSRAAIRGMDKAKADFSTHSHRHRCLYRRVGNRRLPPRWSRSALRRSTSAHNLC